MLAFTLNLFFSYIQLSSVKPFSHSLRSTLTVLPWLHLRPPPVSRSNFSYFHHLSRIVVQPPLCSSSAQVLIPIFKSVIKFDLPPIKNHVAFISSVRVWEVWKLEVTSWSSQGLVYIWRIKLLCHSPLSGRAKRLLSWQIPLSSSETSLLVSFN